MTKQNECYVCKAHIDESDCNETYITAKSKWFMMNEKMVKGRNIILCGDCGLKIIHIIDDMGIEHDQKVSL